MPEIDFGDPIDFSPTGSTKPASPIRNVDMGMANARPKPSIAREPAHMATDFGPIFPHPHDPSQQNSMQELGQGQAPLMSASGQPVQLQAPLSEKPKKGKLLFVVIAVVGVVMLIVIVALVLTSLGKKPTTSTQNTTNQTTNTTNTTASNTTNTVTVADPTADPDGDALTNQEEAKYGTDPNNPDSDGDTFKDGAEVEKGFNPLGAGKLTTPQL